MMDAKFINDERMKIQDSKKITTGGFSESALNDFAGKLKWICTKITVNSKFLVK